MKKAIPVVHIYEGMQYLLIKTQLAEAIAKAVHGCYLSDVLGDGDRLAMPWTLETTQQVARWQVPTVSPMILYYNFPGKFEPYMHQYKICSFLTAHKRAFCLADMGTGKTASAVWCVDYLLSNQKAKRVLVVGVLSNMKSTWVEEFFAVNPTITVDILHGCAEDRLHTARGNATVHVINHDGVEVIKDQLMENNYDIVIVDELTAYKNDKTDRFKALFGICAKAEYVWGLTGTPMPNRPDETYGQIKLIRPDSLQGISAYRYKEMVMRKFGQFTWKPKFDAHETVNRYMQPAIKIEKLEVLELPPVKKEYVQVPLTKEQTLFYKELKDNQFIGDEDIAISAVNGGALMMKLLQVSTGAIYTDDGTAMQFDVAHKVDIVIDLIKQAREKSTDPLKGKTLVFAPFRHTVAMLEKALSQHFKVETITGDTQPATRADIFFDFQTTAEPDVIIAVARTMSHGVTATSASTIIWFGPVTSNEVYQQACNRIDRPGQSQEMTIYHLYSTPVEEKIYKTLQERKLSQADLLNMYTDFIRGI